MSVWKKNEPEYAPPPPVASTPAPSPVAAAPAVSPPPPVARPADPPRPRGVATIGPSIAIKGDVTGEEDLQIEGRIEGKILLKSNSVTIGRNGRVKANVYANSITVEGEVEGDLIGKDEVVIRQSGKVKGNVAAPRVVLDSGARFQGSIDMEPQRPAEPARADAKQPERQDRPVEKPAEKAAAPPLKQAAIGSTT